MRALWLYQITLTYRNSYGRPIFVAEKNTRINPPKLKGMTLVQSFHDAAFCICDEIEQQVDLFTVSDLFGDAFDGLGSIQLR